MEEDPPSSSSRRSGGVAVVGPLKEASAALSSAASEGELSWTSSSVSPESPSFPTSLDKMEVPPPPPPPPSSSSSSSSSNGATASSSNNKTTTAGAAAEDIFKQNNDLFAAMIENDAMNANASGPNSPMVSTTRRTFNNNNNTYLSSPLAPQHGELGRMGDYGDDDDADANPLMLEEDSSNDNDDDNVKGGDDNGAVNMHLTPSQEDLLLEHQEVNDTFDSLYSPSPLGTSGRKTLSTAASASASASAVVVDDSLLQQQLEVLEEKVVLGSDEMLHHRRLPSTIYEQDSKTAVLDNENDDEDDGEVDFFVDFLGSSTASATTTTKDERLGKDEEMVSSLLQLLPQVPPPQPSPFDLGGGGVAGGANNKQQLAPSSTSSSLPSQPTKSFSFDNLQKLLRQQLQPEEQQQSEQHYHQHHHSEPTISPLWQKQQDQLLSRLKKEQDFFPIFRSTRLYQSLSRVLLSRHYSPAASATWVGFWAMLHVTCSNYVLTPLRDAIALSHVGVVHMPTLTLVSTALAFGSSVPIGWLFEAPDPSRRRLWKRMGLTRGETQGTSLALFYRCFAITLVSYAIVFQLLERYNDQQEEHVHDNGEGSSSSSWFVSVSHVVYILEWFLHRIGKSVYVAFFLVVHLMKLHSTSLVWGVTTEAMEYEEVARRKTLTGQVENNQTRLQRLALVGFGGTLGGILGSVLASTMAHYVRLPGLLLIAALLLEISAEHSIELGRIMQKHWEEQQLFQSSNDLASLDASMKRSVSVGSMKRVASGNSLNRVRSDADLQQRTSGNCLSPTTAKAAAPEEPVNDNTFVQRLLRGVTTIVQSRLLMAIFTYNALYASTNVLLSFQRAELVANRNTNTTAEADTAFLARINMASSVAIFSFQASGFGAYVAHKCGSRGTLTLMPLIRLLGVLSLAWWHQTSNGKPPNLLLFLVLDECCKVMNLAVAKPVRESLWRGLSNEARYEAKPIVDTLANRWGGGSAAFLVSFLNRTLEWFGVEPGAERNILGFPPILFLCLLIAAWWTVVSADLGLIRKNIDLELKKRQ